MNGIYLVIGGNMGEREIFLSKSIEDIASCIGDVQMMSAVYETESWGNTAQNAFLNQVLYVTTHLSSREVLNACLGIEKSMGRVREQKWGSRIIDIDILFFNKDIILEENLKIPHPFLHERKFVLVPLNEIASGFMHPVLHKTVQELLNECDDELEVRRFN